MSFIAKNLKIRKELPENLNFYKTPVPKNKDIGKFMSDWESIKSSPEKNRLKQSLPSSYNDAYSFGIKNHKEQNIGRSYYFEFGLIKVSKIWFWFICYEIPKQIKNKLLELVLHYCI